jgi:photosystem II stability/assembly factor-like uncharacterized protein
VASTTTPPTAPSSGVPSVRLVRLAFFSLESGYGLFEEDAPTCGVLVGFTTDGGGRFGRLVPVTTGSCSGAASVSELAFDDHGDGFAYGPDLFETHDGGSSWRPVPQPGQVLSVAALGSSVWMVETGCSRSTNPQSPCPMRLLESIDGGSTWQPVVTPAGLTLNSGFASGGGQTWLLRLSQTTAYLSSNLPIGTPVQVPTTAPLWVTSDSGRTWSARSIPCGFPAFVVSLSAAPDGTLFAVCAGQPGAGNQLKSVLRSSDGGATWTVAFPCDSTGASIPANCAATVLSGGYLGGIDAVSSTTVFLVGGRSSLLVTRDGGATWKVVAPPIGDTSDGTSTVTFFDPSNGIVLGYDGMHDDVSTIWSTADGGLTWCSVVPFVPSYAVSGSTGSAVKDPGAAAGSCGAD